jgi:ligand-binding sensor protein
MVGAQRRQEMPLQTSEAEWVSTDLKAMQSVLDDFATITGISLVIMDANCNRVTEQTLPFNRLCMDLIKKTPVGKKACEQCDMQWSREAAEDQTYKVYVCKHGLIDFVSPIMCEGELLGYLFGGQIRVAASSGEEMRWDPANVEAMDEAVNTGKPVALPREWYERHAKALMLDSKEYLEALDDVAVLPYDKIEASARVLDSIAKSISSMISAQVREIRVTVRKVWIALAGGYPYAELWATIWGQLQQLPVRG